MLHRGTLYDELLHVPLIMWGTHVPDGVVDDHLVSTVDIVPTILAAARVDPPNPLAGRNLLPPRRDTAEALNQATSEFVFAQYGRELYAVRGHRWKLIQRIANGHEELYDLDRDPAERHNVIGDEPAVAAELRSRLAAWRAGLSTQAAPPTAQLSAEQRNHLEALGYVTE
jgi:arylsulfatase A-like enzyme